MFRTMLAPLVIIAAAIVACTNDSDGSRLEACIAAEHFVDRQLASPGSASHQSCNDRDVSQDGNKWTVRGHVDSQNAFGAMLRSHYRVVMVAGEQRWEVDSISVQ
jgi:hypothetical protein